MRRRLLPPEPARAAAAGAAAPVVDLPQGAEDPELTPVHVSGVELRTVLGRLRQQYEAQVEEMREAIVKTSALTEQGSRLRERCRATRDVRGARTVPEHDPAPHAG